MGRDGHDSQERRLEEDAGFWVGQAEFLQRASDEYMVFERSSLGTVWARQDWRSTRRGQVWIRSVSNVFQDRHWCLSNV